MIKGYMTTDALILFFLFFALTVAIVIKSIKKVWNFIPFTPTLFIASIIMGKFSDHLGIIGDSLQATSGIDPRGILLIFLPPLIFESSFNSDWYVFRRQSAQIFILAFPCVLIGALVIMFSIKFIIGYDDTYYTMTEAFMFGSVLSCTDTVAVLSLLKEAGAPKKFSSLIEGQSLLNDGSCMVLFTISLELCRGGSMGVLDITLLFFQLTLGAAILGILFGIIAVQLIKFFKNDPLLCFNTTLVGCYLVYFIAEYVNIGIHVSGIMALVSMGLYMAAFGRTKFTIQARQRVDHIWKVYVFVAETVIFILGGVIVGRRSLNNPELIDLIGTYQIICLLALYLTMVCARFLSISVFMPKLKQLGYGLKWSEVMALTYGGLRGAVGIAFTLILASYSFLPEKFKSISVFNMAGCAFLTMMINAPTCNWVIVKLGLTQKSDTKVKLFNKFMRICSKDLEEKMEHTRTYDKYLSNSNWEKVEQLSGLEDLYNLTQVERKGTAQFQLNRLDSGYQKMSEDIEVDKTIMIEIRSRFGLALKGIFWRKFQNNECSDESVKKLTQCVDLDLDAADEPMNSWDYLISQEQNNIFYAFVFWLRQFPIVNNYALGQIYQKVSTIYDLVSTYIESIEECQQQSNKFPFEKSLLRALKAQSSHNRKLAQQYLDTEVKNSFPQIMKKIQTGKVSASLLNYQLQLLQQNHKQGRVDMHFFLKIKLVIEKNIEKIQNDSYVADKMPNAKELQMLSVFSVLQNVQFSRLMEEKIEKIYHKDEPIIRSYQLMRFIFFIVKGEVVEEWKLPNQNFKKRTLRTYDFVGLSQLCIPRSQDIGYSATATSVVCLFGFPIQRFKDFISKNNQFQAAMNVQMLPVMVLLIKQIDFAHIPHLVWNRIKQTVEYNRVPKQHRHTVQNVYVIVVEGSITVGDKLMEKGYYKLIGAKGVITGPAKYMTSIHPFEDIRQTEKRYSEVINRGIGPTGPTVFDKALRQ